MARLIRTLPDAIATQELGRKLAQLLEVGSVILLEGDLGAGKTTLIQGLGRGLGIEEPIVSPTFTLINEYHEGRLPLYHLDLYRLQASDIPPLYLDMYWQGVEVEPGITAIEWAQRLPYYPPHYLLIQLTPRAGGGRQARISAVGTCSYPLDLL
jgi:tRNA threonylcarbamoyladenosine biosynthesis protein TsaE